MGTAICRDEFNCSTESIHSSHCRASYELNSQIKRAEKTFTSKQDCINDLLQFAQCRWYLKVNFHFKENKVIKKVTGCTTLSLSS